MNRKARGQWFRMKFKAMVRDKTMPSDARFLWSLMESFANQDGTSCHPSVETLMAYAGWGKKKVEKNLRILKERKHVKITGRIKTRNGWVNLYQINYPMTYPEVKRMGPKQTHGVGSKMDPPPEFNKPEWDESDNRTVEEPGLYVLPDPAVPPSPPREAAG